MHRQLMEYHPVIGFRFIPNLKARILHESGGYLIKTNKQGFRCRHDFKKKKNPGTKRILLFGDSYTAGDGVSNGKRFGDFIENLIPSVEVYNFGLPATGPDQHYLIYKECSKDIENDLMIIAVFVENVRRVNARYRHFYNEYHELVLYSIPYYILKNERLILENVPPPKKPIKEGLLQQEEKRHIFRGSRFPKVKKIINNISTKPPFESFFKNNYIKQKLLKIIRYQPIKEYNNFNNPSWLLLRAILKKWIYEHEKPVILVPIPMYHYVWEISNASKYIACFSEVADETGCIFHNALPDLLNYSISERRKFYYEKDEHLTESGHLAFAKSLISSIRKVINLE